jgi:hypothetical protein
MEQDITQFKWYIKCEYKLDCQDELLPKNRRNDKDIWDDLPKGNALPLFAHFYLPQDFMIDKMDTTGFLLEHLPAVLDENFFITEVYEKQRALDMVTSQISNKVMSNSNAFSRI